MRRRYEEALAEVEEMKRALREHAQNVLRNLSNLQRPAHAQQSYMHCMQSMSFNQSGM